MHTPHTHTPHTHTTHTHTTHTHTTHSHNTHSHNTHSHNTHSHNTHSHTLLQVSIMVLRYTRIILNLHTRFLTNLKMNRHGENTALPYN